MDSEEILLAARDAHAFTRATLIQLNTVTTIAPKKGLLVHSTSRSHHTASSPLTTRELDRLTVARAAGSRRTDSGAFTDS